MGTYSDGERKSYKFWTDEEVNELIQMHGAGYTDKEIALSVGRTQSSVLQKRAKLREEGRCDSYLTEPAVASTSKVNNKGRKRKRKNVWSDEEVERLREMHSAGMNDTDIARKLGRSRKSVSSKRVKLGLYMPGIATWTEEEVEFVTKNYKEMTDKEMGKVLGRSALSVSDRRRRDGLKKRKGVKEEIDMVISKMFWEGASDREIADKLERSTSSVERRRQLLGLYKAERDRMRRVYFLYDGDELLARGTIEEIAKERGIKTSTVLKYKQKSTDNMHIVEVTE